MRLGASASAARSASAVPYATSRSGYPLNSTGWGPREVWVSFGDAAGNWSDPIGDTIVYDPPPTADAESFGGAFVDDAISLDCAVTLDVIDGGDKDTGQRFANGAAVRLVGAADGGKGTTAINSGAGTVTYSASRNGPFTDTFQYTIEDARGSARSAKVTLRVDVETQFC
jgi:hypothetical protein